MQGGGREIAFYFQEGDDGQENPIEVEKKEELGEEANSENMACRLPPGKLSTARYREESLICRQAISAIES